MILDANDRHKFSEQEMYLLLAGVYLHDIGMQCDVLNIPHIKNRAEILGANFESSSADTVEHRHAEGSAQTCSIPSRLD